MSDVMSIGRYQLENLMRAGIRFTFLDLRTDAERASKKHEAVAQLLTTARAVAPEAALELLQTEKAAPDAAIILICEDGVKSKGLSLQLEEAGFKNVYRVEGGVAAL